MLDELHMSNLWSKCRWVMQMVECCIVRLKLFEDGNLISEVDLREKSNTRLLRRWYLQRSANVSRFRANGKSERSLIAR